MNTLTMLPGRVGGPDSLMPNYPCLPEARTQHELRQVAPLGTAFRVQLVLALYFVADCWLV